MFTFDTQLSLFGEGSSGSWSSASEFAVIFGYGYRITLDHVVVSKSGTLREGGVATKFNDALSFSLDMPPEGEYARSDISCISADEISPCEGLNFVLVTTKYNCGFGCTYSWAVHSESQLNYIAEGTPRSDKFVANMWLSKAAAKTSLCVCTRACVYLCIYVCVCVCVCVCV